MLISRSEAKSKGLSVYMTGKACKYGHITYRYTKSKLCMECAKGYGRRQAESGYSREMQEKIHQRNRDNGITVPDDRKRLEARTRQVAKKRGIPWSIEDDISLQMLFYLGLSGEMVSVLLGRTYSATMHRRIKFKK